MKTSPNISNLAKALLKAQMKMGAAVKGAKNPFFKSSYADLPTVMEVVKDPLNEEGILVLQPATHRDGKNFISTILIHAESGEFAESETEVICSKANDPQAFGAAQTYARRFGLQAMAFVPSEDDDGNQAAGRQAPKAVDKPTPAVKNVTNSAVVASTPAATAPTETKKSSAFRKNTVVNGAAPAPVTASVGAAVAATQDEWN